MTGGDVDVASIKTALDGVIDSKSWTSWWGKARKHPRVLTSGTGSRLRYSVSDSAEDAADLLLTDGIKVQIVTLHAEPVGIDQSGERIRGSHVRLRGPHRREAGRIQRSLPRR